MSTSSNKRTSDSLASQSANTSSATSSTSSKKSNDVSQLRQRTGAAPLAVLYCPSCLTPSLADANNVQPHEKYDWGLSLCCYTCTKNWTICSRCSNQRNPMLSSAAIYLHHYKRHRTPTEKRPVLVKRIQWLRTLTKHPRRR